MSAHPKCNDGHVCQRPSGRRCYEQPCDEPAGTLWGPYWCPDHDRERLNRIGAQIESLRSDSKEDEE